MRSVKVTPGLKVKLNHLMTLRASARLDAWATLLHSASWKDLIVRTVGHAGTLTWSDSPRNWRRMSASSSVVALGGDGGRGRRRESRLREPLRFFRSDELDVAYQSSSTLIDEGDPEEEGVGVRRRDDASEGVREDLREPSDEEGGGEGVGERRPLFFNFLSSRGLREERPRESLESVRSFLPRDLD